MTIEHDELDKEWDSRSHTPDEYRREIRELRDRCVRYAKELTELREELRTALAAPRPEPSGYAYRYADNVLRFNDGGWLSGWPPVEAVPYWFAPPAAVSDNITLPREVGEHLTKMLEECPLLPNGDWSERDCAALTALRTALAAPSPEPLTDEEALRLWAGDAPRPVMGKNKVLAFTRAIERAHNIKGDKT